MRNLTAREREVLRDLRSEWVTPMMIGGKDESDHSRILRQLVAKGLVQRRRRNSLMNMLNSSRGSYEYRLAVAEGTGQ